MIKQILLFIWQLPQNIIGIILFLILRNWITKGDIYYFLKQNDKENSIDHYKYIGDDYKTKKYLVVNIKNFNSISLGNFVFLDTFDLFTVLHEYGHQKQSKKLGFLYLIFIGLPSITCNIYGKIFHRKWSNEKIIEWYYNLPWEKNANKLSNLEYSNNNIFKFINE